MNNWQWKFKSTGIQQNDYLFILYFADDQLLIMAEDEDIFRIHKNAEQDIRLQNNIENLSI